MTNYTAITIISILLIIVPTISKYSYSLIVANNPFYSMSDSKIHSIKSHSPDGKMRVNLEYSPDEMKSGAITFFKINFFDSAGNDRTRHVDCDLIIKKDNLDLFKASEQYGEPSIHSPDGIMLTSFGFNETGNYRISVEIEGLNFFPIKPLFVDFGATVSHLSDGSLKIVLST